MTDRRSVVAGLMLVLVGAHGADTMVLEEDPERETVAREQFALTADAPLEANETWNLEVYTDRSVRDFPTYLIVPPVRFQRTIGLEKMLANDVPRGAPPFSRTFRLTDRFAAIRGLQRPVEDVKVRVVVVRPRGLSDVYEGGPVKRRGLTVRARSRRGVIASRRIETELQGAGVDPDEADLVEIVTPREDSTRRADLAALARLGLRPAYQEGDRVYFRLTDALGDRLEDELDFETRPADIAVPVRLFPGGDDAKLAAISAPDDVRRLLLSDPDSAFWLVLANASQQTALSERGFRIMPRVPAEDRPRPVTVRLRQRPDGTWPSLYGVDLAGQYGHIEQGDVRVITGAAWDDAIGRIRRPAPLAGEVEIEINEDERP